MFKSLAKLLAGSAFAAIGIAVAGGTALAGSSTGTLSVTASVAAHCTVSAPTLAFGSYDPIGANASAVLDGTTTATFTCTKKSAGVYVTADTGANPTHATGTCAVATCTRAMADGSGDYLSYDLYTDSGHTVVWNTTNSGGHTYQPTFDTSTTATATVYGEIPAGTQVPAGSYSDSVTMTINF